MGIPNHLTCLLRNLYSGQEATFRTRHEKRTGSKLGKEYIKAVYCHPTYLTYMQSTSWEMLGWMKHKLESRLLGEHQKPQICRWHHSYGRKWKGTKKPLDEGERGEWKTWLKTQCSKNKDYGILCYHFRRRQWHPTPVLLPGKPLDGGAWKAAVHGVTEGQTRLSDFTFTFHFHALEKETATHFSTLAWRIPGTGEPGGLPSMGCTELDTTEMT